MTPFTQPPVEVKPLRTVAFFDGQNVFHAIKSAFGFKHPNYDPLKLANHICEKQGWILSETRFYTGIPDSGDNAFWHHFWSAKLAQMGRQGVAVYSRPLKYRNQTFKTAEGGEFSALVGQEKGIDIRIALDIVRLAHRKDLDVALVFSQDQDLSEVADEIRMISKEQGRFIKIACTFPVSPTYSNARGINKTDWIRFDREAFTRCIDPRDYRSKN